MIEKCLNSIESEIKKGVSVADILAQGKYWSFFFFFTELRSGVFFNHLSLVTTKSHLVREPALSATTGSHRVALNGFFIFDEVVFFFLEEQLVKDTFHSLTR